MSVSDTSVSIVDWVAAIAPSGLPVAWLAGYPRSGAALVRTILAHCFGHQTASIYSETNLGEEYARALNAMGQVTQSDRLVALVKCQGLMTFKTHERGQGIGYVPTIIIVRDGRRTFESLKAFYAERNATDYTMMDLILGNHYWRDWTDWVRSWACNCRPDTQWLRYEDIMADVPGTVDRLAARWGLTPIAHEIPPFESLHKAKPDIFRGCAVDGNGGMTDEEEATFWALHGSTMTMLGYHQ